MVNIKLAGLCSLASLLPGAPAFSQEPANLSQTLSFTAYYSDGDYGEAIDSEILYFPVSYSANLGKLGFQISVPYLQATGLGSVLINVGGINRAVAGTQKGRSRGIGDSVVSLTYQLDPIGSAALFVDLRLDIKLPTADEFKGLGSGETDYSVQLDVSKNLRNSVLFASLGYSFRGRSVIYPGLKDAAFVQLGIAKSLSQEWNIGVFYDFREQASIFSTEIHEIAPYFSWQFSDNWSFTGLTSWGFTQASADITVLGQLSYRW